jgi:hypothetical protein
LVGSPCDTLTGIETYEFEKSEMDIYFHSGLGLLYVNAHGLQARSYVLSVFNSNGKLIYSEIKKLSSSFLTSEVEFSGNTTGMYFVTIQTDSEILTSKFLKAE